MKRVREVPDMEHLARPTRKSFEDYDFEMIPLAACKIGEYCGRSSAGLVVEEDNYEMIDFSECGCPVTRSLEATEDVCMEQEDEVESGSDDTGTTEEYGSDQEEGERSMEEFGSDDGGERPLWEYEFTAALGCSPHYGRLLEHAGDAALLCEEAKDVCSPKRLTELLNLTLTLDGAEEDSLGDKAATLLKPSNHVLQDMQRLSMSASKLEAHKLRVDFGDVLEWCSVDIVSPSLVVCTIDVRQFLKVDISSIGISAGAPLQVYIHDKNMEMHFRANQECPWSTERRASIGLKFLIPNLVKDCVDPVASLFRVDGLHHENVVVGMLQSLAWYLLNLSKICCVCRVERCCPGPVAPDEDDFESLPPEEFESCDSTICLARLANWRHVSAIHDSLL